MLPSRAAVGDTIHFTFPKTPGQVITGFQVTINGKKVRDPEMVIRRSKTGDAAVFVFQVTEPGIYQFVITPIIEGSEKGEPRLNTLEVPPQSLRADS
jgi:hypothetical protein